MNAALCKNYVFVSSNPMIEEKVHFYKLNIKIGINNIKIKQYKNYKCYSKKVENVLDNR